jgi:hypothetical protein
LSWHRQPPRAAVYFEDVSILIQDIT